MTKPKAKHRYTVDEFWRVWQNVWDVGERLRDRVRDGTAHEKERDDLVKQQKHVQSLLRLPGKEEKEKLKERGKTSSNEILVHDIIIETSLKYRDWIITPLRNWGKGEKDMDWWHPLYRFGAENAAGLMKGEWKKDFDKALKMAERKDRKEGGHRKEAMDMMTGADKMDVKVDKRHKELEEQNKEEAMSDELMKLLKGIVGWKISSKELKGISDKVAALEKNVIDIRMKQNKRIQREKEVVKREGRALTKIKKEIRKAYGDPKMLRRVSVEFEEVKVNQKERINKENMGEDIGELVNKLKREVKEINKKQMQRIERENSQEQERRDEEQDKKMDEIETKMMKHIGRLRAELDVLKEKVNSS